VGKNNQKKEKAKRNEENARKYKKRPVSNRGRRFGGPRPSTSAGGQGATPAPPSEAASDVV
jgi:hypothetical protein